MAFPRKERHGEKLAIWRVIWPKFGDFIVILAKIWRFLSKKVGSNFGDFWGQIWRKCITDFWQSCSRAFEKFSSWSSVQGCRWSLVGGLQLSPLSESRATPGFLFVHLARDPRYNNVTRRHGYSRRTSRFCEWR